MSRRYSPSMIARSSSTVFLLSRKPVMPNSSSTDEIGIVAQRGQGQLRFFRGHEATKARDRCSKSVERASGALHYAAAEHNGVRREERGQIRQSQPEIVSLPLARLKRQ